MAKGGGFLAGGQILEFASRFVVAFLLARLIGADGYGLYSLAVSAAAVFATISAFGLDTAMIRYVSVMAARRDGPGLLGTVQVGLGVSAVGGLAMAATLHAVGPAIASALFDDARLGPLLQLLAFVVPFLTVSNVLAGCLRGFARMDHVTLAESVIQPGVRVALLAGLAVVGLDVRAAVLAFGISDVAASITLVLLLGRQPSLRRPTGTSARRETWRIISFALPLWFSGVLNQFRKNLEIVFLGVLSTAANVGIFAIVSRVNLLGHVGYRSVTAAVKPVLAALHDEGDRDGLARVYGASTRWTLAMNLPFFVVTVLYAEPLLHLFGSTVAAGATALVVLAAAEVVVAGTGTCGSLIDMTGHPRVKLVNSILWVALLIAGNGLLIPRWGVLGAAVASFIAIVTVNILRVLEVWILEGLLPYRRHLWKPAAAATLSFGAGLGMRAAVVVDASPGAAAVQAAMVVSIYAGLLLAFGLQPEDRLIIDRVASRARRIRRRSATRRLMPGGTP